MVYRVPLTWTDRELKEAFLPHGDIVSVSLAPKSDGETGHRRFGDVTYRHASSLAELLKCATLGFDRKTGREQYELELSGHRLALSRKEIRSNFQLTQESLLSQAEKGMSTQKVTVVGPSTVRAKLGDSTELRLLVKNMSNQDVRLEKVFWVPRKPEFTYHVTGGPADGRRKSGGEPSRALQRAPRSAVFSLLTPRATQSADAWRTWRRRVGGKSSWCLSSRLSTQGALALAPALALARALAPSPRPSPSPRP